MRQTDLNELLPKPGMTPHAALRTLEAAIPAKKRSSLEKELDLLWRLVLTGRTS